MRATFLVAAAALVLDGCAPTVSATRLQMAPPQPADHEILLFAAKLPTCAYDELGLVSVEPSYGGASEQKLLDALKRHARVMGGDAVVRLTHGRNASDTVIGSTVQFGDSWTVLSGTVIRFSDPDCHK